MDPTLTQSFKQITHSTSRMLKSATIIDPNKLNEAGSIVSESVKALDQHKQDLVSEVTYKVPKFERTRIVNMFAVMEEITLNTHVAISIGWACHVDICVVNPEENAIALCHSF
jgi:hypothetical protein